MRNPYAPNRKQCRACGEIQAIVEFRLKTAVCHRCDLERQGKWRAAHPEASVIGNRRYRTKNSTRLLENQKLRMKREPLKYRARKLLLRAVAAGRIKKLPCAHCGSSKSEAHHLDYTQPMLVEWLCHKCHWRAHHAAA